MTDQLLSGVSVLIADDSDINRLMLTKILERAGARVFGVANGRKAVELVREHGDELDVVSMDLQMPELDGEQATRIIRGELGRRRMPIIALSAGVLETDRAQALAAEMNDFIQKPFARQALLEAVASHVARFRSPTPSSAPAPEHGVVEGDWPEIDGLDTEDVKARLSGDQGLFRSLLEHLRRELDELCDEAKLEGKSPEFEPWIARLHKLRGTAGNLGARHFAEAASELEKRARARDAGFSIELGRLSVKAAALSRSLRSAPAARAAARSPEPPTALEWERFLAALSEQDLDALDSFPRMSAWLGDRIGAARLDELRAAVNRLEFARALELAREVTTELGFDRQR